MRALGIDFGEKRIGVAVSDDGGLLATPYDTVHRVGDRRKEHGRLLELVDETGAGVAVVGMPYSLDGEMGAAARAIANEVRGLVKRCRKEERTLEIEFQDERFTTVTAEQQLAAGGLKKRQQRAVIDATAAAVLLQAWLDGRRGLQSEP